MPTSTKVPGWAMVPWWISLTISAKPPPKVPPMTSAGANTPPEPPAPSVMPVASILPSAMATRSHPPQCSERKSMFRVG